MAHPQLPPAPNLKFYMSDSFLSDAHAAGINRIGFNSAETREVVRIARLDDTLADLGGLALLGVNEQENIQREAEKPGELVRIPDDLENRIALNEWQDFTVIGRSSWGEVKRRMTEGQKSLIAIASEPTEVAVAQNLYQAAVMSRGKTYEDTWFDNLHKPLDTALGGILGAINLGLLRASGSSAGKPGQSAGEMRHSYNLSDIVPTKKPVTFGYRGSITVA